MTIFTHRGKTSIVFILAGMIAFSSFAESKLTEAAKSFVIIKKKRYPIDVIGKSNNGFLIKRGSKTATLSYRYFIGKEITRINKIFAEQKKAQSLKENAAIEPPTELFNLAARIKMVGKTASGDLRVSLSGSVIESKNSAIKSTTQGKRHVAFVYAADSIEDANTIIISLQQLLSKSDVAFTGTIYISDDGEDPRVKRLPSKRINNLVLAAKFKSGPKGLISNIYL